MHTSPLDHARYIFYIASSGFITGSIGLYLNKYLLGVSSYLGSCVSMLYWYSPEYYSWRRILDIVYVQYLMWIHIYTSYYTPVFYDYLLTQVMAIYCFILSWYYAKLELHTWATIMHVVVHLIANISASILYLKM